MASRAALFAMVNMRRRRERRRTENPPTTPEHEMAWDDGVLLAWDGVGTDEPILMAWDS